ncbi:hypothetical protein QBC44DRAFT_313783 [Cladorrhinum sp. PSN332]|nr:hypothetical protein QBC44DRAFT_313783 [Cladorrhinum sp. PSN332]
MCFIRYVQYECGHSGKQVVLGPIPCPHVKKNPVTGELSPCSGGLIINLSGNVLSVEGKCKFLHCGWVKPKNEAWFCCHCNHFNSNGWGWCVGVSETKWRDDHDRMQMVPDQCGHCRCAGCGDGVVTGGD